MVPDVVVSRGDFYAYRDVAVDVIIDEETRGSVRNNESIAVAVDSGVHVLRVGVSNERSNTLEFELDSDESTHFEVRPRIRGIWTALFPILVFMKGNLQLIETNGHSRVVDRERGIDSTVLTGLLPRGRILWVNLSIAIAGIAVLVWVSNR